MTPSRHQDSCDDQGLSLLQHQNQQQQQEQQRHQEQEQQSKKKNTTMPKSYNTSHGTMTMTSHETMKIAMGRILHCVGDDNNNNEEEEEEQVVEHEPFREPEMNGINYCHQKTTTNSPMVMDPREERVYLLSRKRQLLQQQKQRQQKQQQNDTRSRQQRLPSSPSTTTTSSIVNYISKSPLLQGYSFATNNNNKNDPMTTLTPLTSNKSGGQLELSPSTTTTTTTTPHTAGQHVLLIREDHVSLEHLNPCPSSQLRQSSSMIAMMNLVATVCGGGVLSLPLAFSRAGIVPTTILMIMGAIVTDFSLVCLIDSARKIGGRTYGDVAAAAFGTMAQIVTNITLACMLCGSLIAYQVLVKDVWTPVVFYLLSQLQPKQQQQQHLSSSSLPFLSSPSSSLSLESNHDLDMDEELFRNDPTTETETNNNNLLFDYNNVSPEQAHLLLAIILIVSLPLLLQKDLHSLRHTCYIGFCSCLLLMMAVVYRACQQLILVNHMILTTIMTTMTDTGNHNNNNNDRNLMTSGVGQEWMKTTTSTTTDASDPYNLDDYSSYQSTTTTTADTTTTTTTTQILPPQLLEIKWWTNNPTDLLFAFPIVILCYFCSYNVLAVQAQLVHPTRQRMRWVLKCSMGSCCVLFWLVGVGGYLYTVAIAATTTLTTTRMDNINITPDNLLLAFELQDPAILAGRMGFCFTLLFGLPLILLPCREAFVCLPLQIQAWRRDVALIAEYRKLDETYKKKE